MASRLQNLQISESKCWGSKCWVPGLFSPRRLWAHCANSFHPSPATCFALQRSLGRTVPGFPLMQPLSSSSACWMMYVITKRGCWGDFSPDKKGDLQLPSSDRGSARTTEHFCLMGLLFQVGLSKFPDIDDPVYTWFRMPHIRGGTSWLLRTPNT